MPVLPTRNVCILVILMLLSTSQLLLSKGFGNRHSAFSNSFGIRQSAFGISERVMPGAITIQSTDTLLSVGLVDAALALTFETTGAFAYLPISVRDSILRIQDSTKQTLAEAAKKLGASAIVFATVSRVQNLIRVELILATGNEYTDRLAGIGFASMNYANEETSKPLAEPAVLNAFQRALERALNDPELYKNADSVLRVIPTDLIAVGGVEFKTVTLDLPQWDLFKERTVSSYDLAQTIVHSLQSHKNYTTVDIETRDSMFAMAGFYLVENYHRVATEELRILRLFDIRRVITGTFERTMEGAKLELMLCSIADNDTYSVIKSESLVIKSDSKDAFQKAVDATVQKLMK